MHRQWVRLTSVIIMLVVTVVSASHVLQLEQRRENTQAQGDRLDELLRSLDVSLADLRAAQQAYVASGQDPQLWVARVDRELHLITSALDELESRVVTRDAVEAIADARSTLDQWARVDGVARGHTVGGQTLLASDLAFADGHELTQRASGHLALVRSLERDARTQQREELQAAQIWAAAGAGVVIVLVTLLLLPRPPSPAAKDSGTRGEQTAEPRGAMDEKEAATERAGKPSPSPTLDAPSTQDRSGAPDFTPDLAKAARICTDLSRLSSRDSLNLALAEACRLLDAAGLIVWLRDGNGGMLRAAAGHGYPSRALARLDHVTPDDDNVTAAAFRTARLQMIGGDDDALSAVAVPLLSVETTSPTRASHDEPTEVPHGSSFEDCLGVLSIELPAGRETNPGLQATATIFAAQLATLLGSEPAPANMDDADGSAGTQAEALG